MEEVISKIIEVNNKLFGNNPTTERINVGFTNTIYNINNSFIVKICTDISNEENFKKEIDFYKANEKNNLIPKLYYSNIEKLEVPYYYEILENILSNILLKNVGKENKEKAMLYFQFARRLTVFVLSLTATAILAKYELINLYIIIFICILLYIIIIYRLLKLVDNK